MAKNINKENLLEHINIAFHLFDTSGDGFINSSAVGRLMRSIGLHPTEKHISDIIENINQNNEGSCDAKRLSELCIQYMDKLVVTKSDLLASFQMLDKEGNGLISKQDLRSSLISIGEGCKEEDIEGILHEITSDVDGYIKYKEMVDILL
ncbi:hypothetical protein A3Q56_00058 [Intoshia linei]|uniref:EF-hand domain-containing protein n=1 Tax=Intoshia linei TaxID=1819745 RepID=A0A177BCZ9_9BILA|nr:hypothetical protein A3Q56_00058 [Intoshia linei]